MSTASAVGNAWRSIALVSVLCCIAFVSRNIDIPLVILLCLAAGGSALICGSLVPGLAGAGLGLLCAACTGAVCASATMLGILPIALLLGVVCSIAFTLDHGRQRRGELPWFPNPSLAIASLLIPLLLMLVSATIAQRPLSLGDWSMPVTLSALILLTHGWASLTSGVRGQPPVDGWTLLNSVLGHIVFALSCLTFLTLLPVLMMMPARQRRITSLTRFGTRLVLLVAPGVTWRIAGDHRATPRVIVANHDSMLDVLGASVLPADVRRFLAKPWIFQTPVLGWVARHTGVVSSKAWDSSELVAHPQPAASLVIFPSGSRDDGINPLRFRPGAFVLAERLHLPLQPVALIGTGLAAPRGAWWIRSADLTCVALPPLVRSADESIRGCAERCRTLIAESRLRQLELDLHAGRQQRWLRSWMVGQPPLIRFRMTREWRQQSWHGVLGAPLAESQLTHKPSWLLLGVGWSSCARVIRLLHPTSPLFGVEPDHQRRSIATATWLRPATDHLITQLPDLLPPLGGLVLAVAPDEAAARRLRDALQPDTWIIAAAPWAEAWAQLLGCSLRSNSNNLHPAESRMIRLTTST